MSKDKEPLNATAFDSIGKFEIMYADTNIKNAEIYANGRNQAPVRVRLLLQDSNGNPISNIPEDVIRSSIYLCDFQTGAKLIDKDDAPSNDGNVLFGVNYTLSKDENFCRLASSIHSPSSSSVAYTESAEDIITDVSKEIATVEAGESLGVYIQNGTYLIDLYITADHMLDNGGLPIACGLSTTAGDIETSSIGTSTKLTNGSTFNSPSFIELNTREKIDYSEPKNLMVDGGWDSDSDFTVISKEMEHYFESGPFHTGHTKNNNWSSKAELTLSPAEHDLYFIDDMITQTDGKKPVTLSGVNIYGPGADFIYTKGDKQGANTSFVFIQKTQCGLKMGGQIKFVETLLLQTMDNNYHVKDKNNEPWKHCWDMPLVKNKLRIVFCNHWVTSEEVGTGAWNIRDAEVRRDGWDDPRGGEGNSVTYSVTDQYGNSGVLKFEAIEGNWPRLLVNGHRIGLKKID